MKNYLLIAAVAIALTGCNSSGGSDDGDGSRQAESLDGLAPGGGSNAVTDAVNTVLDLVNDILADLMIDASALTGGASGLADALANVDTNDPTAVAAAVAGVAPDAAAAAITGALNGTNGLGSLGGKTDLRSLFNGMEAAATELAGPNTGGKGLQQIAEPLADVSKTYIASAAALLANAGGFDETEIAALDQLASELMIAADSELVSEREAALSEALAGLVSGLAARASGDNEGVTTALADFSASLTTLLQNFEFTVLDTIALLQLQQSI